jgi:uncharacterized protein (TIGR02266 family)
MVAPGKENRKHPRVSIAVDIDLRSEHNFYAGRTRDISLGGLFIDTDIGLPIGSSVDVKLALDSDEFTLSCEVIWALTDEARRTVGIGLRFLELPGEASRAIEAFMGKRKPMSFEAEVPDEGDGPKLPPPLPKS